MTGPAPLMQVVPGRDDAAAAWLAPILEGSAELTDLDSRRLMRFEHDLRALLAAHPIGPELTANVRSRHLMRIRREMCRLGHGGSAVPAGDGGCGRPVLAQTLMQFVCGYHDLDLRDATGLGHGRLIARHATSPVRDRWLPRLLQGALPGIAITEARGGSQVQSTSTHATIGPGGGWLITGAKTWISRLSEAEVFCVFFTDPDGRLSAAAIDAGRHGLTRHPITPSGLAGWAWGELHLDAVPVRRRDLLGQPGQGMHLLREHFAHYRPLVGATALGAAARVCDIVTAILRRRREQHLIADLRDNALIALGRAHAQINAAFLAVREAQRLSETANAAAEHWGCGVKAHAVDVAYATAAELSLLVGAAGFAATSHLAKTRRDLGGLLYADGIHDSLYRSVGRTLTRVAQAGPIPLPGVCPERGHRVYA